MWKKQAVPPGGAAVLRPLVDSPAGLAALLAADGQLRQVNGALAALLKWRAAGDPVSVPPALSSAWERLRLDAARTGYAAADTIQWPSPSELYRMAVVP